MLGTFHGENALYAYLDRLNLSVDEVDIEEYEILDETGRHLMFDVDVHVDESEIII